MCYQGSRILLNVLKVFYFSVKGDCQTLMDAKFPKSERLQKKREFQKVFDEGRKFTNKELHAFAMPNGTDSSRLGLVVGRKVGNAVRRNRIKRILREAFRLNKGLLSSGVDLVLIPRPGLTSPALSIIEDEFKKLLSKISRTSFSEKRQGE